MSVSRLDSLRQMFHRKRIEESLQLAGPVLSRNPVVVGLQVSATFLISASLILASPWADLVGFAALGPLAAIFGRFAPEGQRPRIVVLCGLTLMLAVGLMSLAGHLGFTAEAKLLVLSLLAGVFTLVTFAGRFGPPGGLIFLFAASAAMGPVSGLAEIGARLLAMLFSLSIAVILALLCESRRGNCLPFPPRPSLRSQMVIAGRISLGAGIAAFLCHGFGAAHPAWAAMGAIAVMQGPHLHVILHRTLQRFAGTLIGAGLAWLILAQEPSLMVVILCLAASQLLTEVLIGAQYGLAQVMITPMALLMTYLAMPAGTAGTEMAPERIFNTLIGVVIGLGFALLLSSQDERLALQKHHQSKQG